MSIQRAVKGVILALALAVVPLAAASRQLSESSFISVLTCGPGAELYSSWGHTAVRVCDPESEMDLIFNYGTFNSSQPAFFWKFLKGDLLYHQSISSFDRFVFSYAKEERVVWEQRLNLTPGQKEAVWEKMLFDSQEENRYYKYNYVADNCTTRVVDAVDLCLPDGYEARRGTATFRELMNRVLWRWELRVSLNLLMGRNGDKVLPEKGFNCLPELYMVSLNNTTTADSEPLVSPEELIVDGQYTPPRAPFYIFPIALLALLVVYGALSLFAPKYAGGYLKGMLAFTLFLTGVLGLVSVFLWSVGFLLADSNTNILWLMPLNIFLMPFIFRYGRFRRVVTGCNLLLTSAGMIMIVFGVQGIEFQSLSFLLFAFATYSLCWIRERKPARGVSERIAK